MTGGRGGYDWWRYAGVYEEAYKKALESGSVENLERMNVLRGGGAEMSYIRALAGLYLPRVEFRGKALDVGCGAGHMTRCLADAGFEAMGVDISESGIALARRNYPDLQFAVADAAESPLAAQQGYDLVLFRGFHPFMRIADFPYQLRLIDAYRRSLRSSGLIAIVNPTPSALDFDALRAAVSRDGGEMVGPFYPNLHKRLGILPQSRADTVLLSTVSGLIGGLLSWGLMSVTLLGGKPDEA